MLLSGCQEAGESRLKLVSGAHVIKEISATLRAAVRGWMARWMDGWSAGKGCKWIWTDRASEDIYSNPAQHEPTLVNLRPKVCLYIVLNSLTFNLQPSLITKPGQARPARGRSVFNYEMYESISCALGVLPCRLKGSLTPVRPPTSHHASLQLTPRVEV